MYALTLCLEVNFEVAAVACKGLYSLNVQGASRDHLVLNLGAYIDLSGSTLQTLVEFQARED